MVGAAVVAPGQERAALEDGHAVVQPRRDRPHVLQHLFGVCCLFMLFYSISCLVMFAIIFMLHILRHLPGARFFSSFGTTRNTPQNPRLQTSVRFELSDMISRRIL